MSGVRASTVKDETVPYGHGRKRLRAGIADLWPRALHPETYAKNTSLQVRGPGKAIRQAEMELKKGQNIIEHNQEIMSRPARTWFQTEKQKKESYRKLSPFKLYWTSLNVGIIGVSKDLHRTAAASPKEKKVCVMQHS